MFSRKGELLGKKAFLQYILPLTFFLSCNRIVAERCFKGVKQLKIRDLKGVLQGNVYKYKALTSLRPGNYLAFFSSTSTEELLFMDRRPADPHGSHGKEKCLRW